MMALSLVLGFLVLGMVAGMDMDKCTVDGVNMCHYKNHDEMISRFQDIETQYPDIAKVENYNGEAIAETVQQDKADL